LRFIAAILVVCFAAPGIARAQVCDPEPVLRAARAAGFSRMVAEPGDGCVSVVLSGDGERSFGVALAVWDGMLFTSESSENRRAERPERLEAFIERVGADEAVRAELERCGRGAFADRSDVERKLRAAADDVRRVPSQRSAARERAIRAGSDELEAAIVAVLLALALVLVAIGARPRADTAPRAHVEAPGEAVGVAARLAVIGIAIVGAALALGVALRFSPQVDEGSTLGGRTASFASLLSWDPGSEPFNPPGYPVLAAAWLRLHGGPVFARMLSIGFVPLTALAAFAGGSALGNRRTGLFAAALVCLAPFHVTLAGVARGYAGYALVLCLLVAAVARTHRGASGVWVALTGLLALFASYLTWPAAAGALVLAKLSRRERFAYAGAMGVAALALVPRIANGALVAVEVSTRRFGVETPLEAIAIASAGAAHGTSALVAHSWDQINAQSIALVGALALVALPLARPSLRPWRGSLARAHAFAGLTVLPLFALLAGGSGIEARHVVCAVVALGFVLALALGALVAHARWRKLGIALGMVVTAASVVTHVETMESVGGFMHELPRWVAPARAVVIVPRQGLVPVHHMLIGDNPPMNDRLDWSADCEGWLTEDDYCVELDRRVVVAVEDVRPAVVAGVREIGSSVWVFESHGVAVPPSLSACRRIHRDQAWTVLRCAPADLAAGSVSP
jgi:hypothetical protein